MVLSEENCMHGAIVKKCILLCLNNVFLPSNRWNTYSMPLVQENKSMKEKYYGFYKMHMI